MTELTAIVNSQLSSFVSNGAAIKDRMWRLLRHQIHVARYLARRTDRGLRLRARAFLQSMVAMQGRPEHHGFLLGAFAMLSALFLGVADLGTREAILERAQEDLRYSLSQVVPANVHDNNLAEDVGEIRDKIEGPISVHRARLGKVVKAVAFELSGQGYGGSIKMLLGIDMAGEILGVRVLAHSETPGLGDKIEQQKSDWILGFDGLSLGNPPAAMWKVKKDGGRFDQFSGATITPRSVVAVIRRGLELFQRKRDEFLNPASKPKRETG
jgi:H+/Na+-translocating ferredoxin:NAD+ oxidoreductase subunit G